MSYDRQIDQLCPHFVVDEALFVSPLDRSTVRPIKSVASAGSVRVRLNGAMDVPAYGVLLPAQSTGNKTGPFNIVAGSNDTLVLSVDQGSDVTLIIPSSRGITADQLVKKLNVVKGMQFSVVRGRISFRSLTEGVGGSVFIRASSTLAPTLGLTANREYRGRKVAPGWTLIVDPSRLEDRPLRLIVFDEPIRDFNAFVEVSYNTVRPDCRRCGGKGVENDWRYGRTGEVAQVRDEALLIQEFQKLIFTIQGSNPFNLWYGTSIENTIGKKLGVSGLIQNMIVSDIGTAFGNWAKIKKMQEEKVGQVLTDAEYPLRLLGVTLQKSDDPTTILVNVTIQNRSSKPIQLTRGLKLPDPLLEASTQGAIRQSLSNFVLSK